MMKYYLDGKRIAVSELKEKLEQLYHLTEYGSAEVIELDEIGPGYMNFITSSYGIYE